MHEARLGFLDRLNKAYDALYSAHDSNNKGFYRREFRCTFLDETKFKLLLSHFCFKTYFKEDYEFSKELLLSYLDNSIKKLELINVRAIDYLEDLCNAICMLIEDGDVYRFSHRSFQSYFAAYYTSSVLTDEQQKKIFEKVLSGKNLFMLKSDYYKLLSQIEPHRFLMNALENRLRVLRHEASLEPNPGLFLVKRHLNKIGIIGKTQDALWKRIAISAGVSDSDRYDHNVINLFLMHIPSKKQSIPFRGDPWSLIFNCLEKVRSQNDEFLHMLIPLTFIDASNNLTDRERSSFYEALIYVFRLDEFQSEVDNWLSSIDKQRESLLSVDFLDNL